MLIFRVKLVKAPATTWHKLLWKPNRHSKCTVVQLHVLSTQSKFQFCFRSFQVKNGHVYLHDLHLNKKAEEWLKLFFFPEVETDGFKLYSVIARDYYLKVSTKRYW